jgi:uncharacterized protein (DUF1778 family)
MGRTALKIDRIAARLTPEQKRLLQRAADLSGRSLTDFVVSSALASAEEVIQTRQIVTLSTRDSLVFAEAVLHPSPPGEALRRAAQRRHELITD